MYDHFYPAYRAGGPIQSLANLALALQQDYEIVLFTGNKDHRSDELLTGIKTAAWNPVVLPGAETVINTWYAEQNKISRHFFGNLLRSQAPAVVYLNGIFSYRFVLIPLLAVNRTKIKLVLCPRGMLQSGALAGKSFKKKIWLAALKLSGLVKKISWHATNEEEEQDIKRIFGNHADVVVAANIPKQPVANISFAGKETGQLRLIYLSLIAAKKNLLQVIELVNRSAAGITLDIYGPVKDAGYWKKCEQAMAAGNGKVIYRGDLRPEQVQDTFSKYDASVLLTRGENFGHALYESLSVGRPVITSYFTPWNALEQKKAGWNLDIQDDGRCLQELERICSMDTETFNSFCSGAWQMANLYYIESVNTRKYHKLFSL